MLIHWIALTLALLIVSHLYSGIRISSLPTAVVAAAVLGILNALVRPVLQFFALPITFLTLGLFYFVINGLMLYWTASLVEGFAVRVEKLRYPDRIVRPGETRTFDAAWFAGANLAVLETEPVGIVTRSVTLDNFVVPFE